MPFETTGKIHKQTFEGNLYGPRLENILCTGKNRQLLQHFSLFSDKSRLLFEQVLNSQEVQHRCGLSLLCWCFTAL